MFIYLAESAFCRNTSDTTEVVLTDCRVGVKVNIYSL